MPKITWAIGSVNIYKHLWNKFMKQIYETNFWNKFMKQIYETNVWIKFMKQVYETLTNLTKKKYETNL